MIGSITARTNELSKKLSEQTKENSYSNDEQMNVLNVVDDLVVVWSKENSCLFTQILSSTQSSVQTFILSSPPIWKVKHLVINNSGSGILLVGDSGVAVVELPKRWGKMSLFESGKDTITCKVIHIGSVFFSNLLSVKVQKAAWHPEGVYDKHIIVLTTDNYIRQYNLNSPELCSDAFAVGSIVSGSVSSYLGNTGCNKFGANSVVGDFAVDFCFGPAKHSQDVKRDKSNLMLTVDEGEKQIQVHSMSWTLFVLHNNGDVYTTDLALNKKRPHEHTLEGPLRMLPSAFDNYGLDFCSISVLPCLPPLLVIGNTGGTMHHCLVMNDEEKNFAEEKGGTEGEDVSQLLADSMSNLKVKSCNQVLHVYESVTIDLSAEESTLHMQNTNNWIFILPDVTTPARYYVCHQNGIHGVVLPLVDRLMQFANAPQESLFPDQEMECQVEHLLCTRPLPSLPSLPIIGLGRGLTPPSLIVLLASSAIQVLSLPPVYIPTLPNVEIGGNSAKDNTSSPTPFLSHIRKLLHKTSPQPLLLSAPTSEALPPHDYFSLFTSVLENLQKEYFLPQVAAREEIQARRSLLLQQKSSLLKQLQELQEEQKEVTAKAVELQEGWKRAQGTQDKINQRLESILSTHLRGVTVLSASERMMQSELEAMHKRMHTFKSEISLINTKNKWHSAQREKHAQNELTRSKAMGNFSDNQMKCIKLSLEKESDKIAALVKQLKSLKCELQF